MLAVASAGALQAGWGASAACLPAHGLGRACTLAGAGAGSPASSSGTAVAYEVEWLEAVAGGVGSRATLRKEQLSRGPASALATLSPELLQRWLETVAWAEPVTVRPPAAAAAAPELLASCPGLGLVQRRDAR